MVYVDLNPIRAGVADTPENSDYTSIQQRIRFWHENTLKKDFVPNGISDQSNYWLCPISSQNDPDGILPMTETEYFDLVDRSGRLIQSDKPGAIDSSLTPILHRFGAKPEEWQDTIKRFEDKFSLVVGLLSSLREFADRLGKKWFTGITAARTSFSAPEPGMT
ncbi:MAG: hypothetical protein P8Y80_02025 [Acidobacteriota bacterium]